MRKVCVLSILLALGMTSLSFAVDPVLLGDFESPVVGDRYDGWWPDGLSTITVVSPGVTRGIRALKGTTATGGWGPGVQVNISGLPDVDGNGRADAVDAAVAAEGCLVVDYTASAADFPDGWCDLGITRNCAAATGGWDKGGWQPMVLDGLPHRMIFMITPETKAAIIEGLEGWGSNLGLCLNMGTGAGTVYIDNVWLLPSPPQDELFPHNGTVEQVEDTTNLDIDATFSWLAAADPNEETGNLVHPLVVDQYVFVNTTAGGPLYYQGSTGDPGNTPESQFFIGNLQFNRSYQWAVVDAIQGYAQTLSVDVSTIDMVDPNNLVGPTWSFNAISTIPTITLQPVNARLPLNATNAQAFTLTVNSLTTPSYQWFSSTDNLIDGADIAINSGSIPSAVTNTLIIPTVASGYQRFYYCRVSNMATVSGGGSEPDTYSNVVSLVVERMLAQYRFENNLNDSVTIDPHNGTGVNGPTFVSADKAEGSYALSLNGTSQYVSLGTTGYPKAVMTYANGIGGAMDVGSVLCWVKATKEGAILGNADPNGVVTLQIEAGGDASMTVRGTNSALVGYASAEPAPYYDLINDGNWHLVAATWNQNDAMHMYVDTVRVDANADPASFVGWQYAGLIGANRANDLDYSVPASFFGGLLDNLRIYNYVVTSETIAQEYYDKTGLSSCIDVNFAGSGLNVDNTGTSYCRVDLADFAQLAENWLASGFYPIQ